MARQRTPQRAASRKRQIDSRTDRFFQMRQLVAILPCDAEVGGKQGDSRRQITSEKNYRGPFRDKS
jgi:hypothetical protein